MNPYSGLTFFEFFPLFFHRLWLFLIGDLSPTLLVSDELQLLVLVGVAATCGMVGTFVVLRKISMLTNALSHTLLLAVVGAYLISLWGFKAQEIIPEVLLLTSLFMALVTVGLTAFFSRVLRVQEDAAIGLLFVFLFALGIILVSSLTRNAHIGIESVMGHIEVVQWADLKMVWQVMGVNALLLLFLFKSYQMVTFDIGFAESVGYRLGWYHFLLMLQVALTSAAAFRAVGVLMVLAFLVVPPVIARTLVLGIGKMVVVSIGVAAGGACLSIALSRHLLSSFDLAVSTAGLSVVILLLLLTFTFLFKSGYEIIKSRIGV